MYAGFGMETDSKTIAEQLGITREKVKEAWDYWEKLELIKRTFSGDDTTEPPRRGDDGAPRRSV